jgi:DNA-directed RNA polymerase sigma subunit (sigma70/sigma32)
MTPEASERLKQKSDDKLTLSLLQIHIPIIKKGEEASTIIKENPNINNKSELLYLIKKADRSKEKLVLAALPLIKTIASNEFKRRRAWGSRITYEDIMQEAIIGFLRGLQSFKIDSNVGSPTNYLGQWITVTIKRKVESLDHDFTIPYEIIERHRRIRAVYTRIANEIERDPSDEELLDALNNDSFTNSGTKWAKASKPSDGVSKKVFTKEHIEEYKNMFNKMYSMGTYDFQPSDDSDSGNEMIADSIYSETVEDYAQIDEKSLNKSRELFFHKVFIEMKMGSKQKDIILRHFGLEPYGESQQRKDIVSQTGVSAKFVKSVIEAFMIYMPVKGGIFHRIILENSTEEIDALELSWIIPILGQWPKGQKEPLEPPEILTQSGLKL